MIFLEIQHPSLHRLRWELQDGVHVFPPPHLEDSVRGCRMRVQVQGTVVHLASLTDGGVLREHGRIVRQTVLHGHSLPLYRPLKRYRAPPRPLSCGFAPSRRRGYDASQFGACIRNSN